MAYAPSSATAATTMIPVDLELSLVVDVSGSVDTSEYTLQMEGYALAFENPALHAKIQGGRQGAIAVNLIQFSSSAAESVPWTLIDSATSSNAFAASIRTASRLFSGGTSPDTGVTLATSSIGGNSYEGTRQVIDVSGDGEGYSTDDMAARDAALAAGIDAINGLPIGETSLEDYYRNNIIGGTDAFVQRASSFEDFEAAVLDKLTREISGDTSASSVLFGSALRSSSIVAAQATTRDIGDRLYRMRAGRPGMEAPAPPPAPPPAADAKGGMAKAPIPAVEQPDRWEVFGSIFYYNQEMDEQTMLLPVVGAVARAIPVFPDTTVDVFGGNVGAEYRIDPSWTVGLAVAGSTTDVDMNFIGSSDIDTLAFAPYVSYYRDGGGGLDFWADLLYAYGTNDYDTRRRVGAGYVSGSPDGDFNQLEFTTGVNLHSGNLVHGPYAGVRWLDGTIDSYVETGVGGALIPSADYESLVSSLGYQVSMPIHTAGGLLVPQFRLGWDHEFEADDANVFGLPGYEPDEDLAVVGAALGYHLASGWNFALSYEGRFGSETESNWVGLRVSKQF